MLGKRSTSGSSNDSTESKTKIAKRAAVNDDDDGGLGLDVAKEVLLASTTTTTVSTKNNGVTMSLVADEVAMAESKEEMMKEEKGGGGGAVVVASAAAVAMVPGLSGSSEALEVILDEDDALVPELDDEDDSPGDSSIVMGLPTVILPELTGPELLKAKNELKKRMKAKEQESIETYKKVVKDEIMLHENHYKGDW